MKINLWGWLKSVLSHNRTAIGSVVTSVAIAGLQSAASGHVNWPAVGAVAVTAVAAAAKSPVLSAAAPAADEGSGGAS